ncbi:MAG: DUF3667 domain-containing protein [Ferruginibacter sp.]
MTNCIECNEIIENKYCSNCGQPASLKRINGKYLLHEINHLLHLEKGFLYTVKELFIRPGESVKVFITQNRMKLVKPIVFIIVTSLIYTIVNHYFSFDKEAFNIDTIKDEKAKNILNWVNANYGYSNIVLGAFIAFYVKIFFNNYRYNYFEILILLYYAMGMSMLIFSLFAIFQGLTQIKSFYFGSIAAIAYCTWAVGQFFDKKKAISYIVALISYILGTFTIMFLGIIIGIVILILSK